MSLENAPVLLDNLSEIEKNLYQAFTALLNIIRNTNNKELQAESLMFTANKLEEIGFCIFTVIEEVKSEKANMN